MNINVTQRIEAGKPRFIKPENLFQPRLFEVAEINSDKVAKEWILRHHYQKSYPAARRRFALVQGGRIVGMAIFGHPANDKTLTNVFAVERAADAVELSRMCLTDEVPFNGESWFLARCRERLQKDFAGIVSFADDFARTDEDGRVIFPGHLGIQYRAGNAVYTGRGTPTRQYLLPDGTVLSKRAISKIRNGETGWEYASRILTAAGASTPPDETALRRTWLSEWLTRLTRIVRHPGCLRYAFPLSSKVRLKVKALTYPQYKFSEVQPNLLSLSAS